jgi:hypothetical protein
MRFMILVKADSAAETGVYRAAKTMDAMSSYIDAMVRAGVLLDSTSLHSSGARIVFTEGERHVIDGPFAETKELAGFWVIQVKSREEAIEWAKRCPVRDGASQIELRQVLDPSDLP